MKLRYHHEAKSHGILVYEADPQIRTINVNSQVKSSMRVTFPYVIFVVRYLKEVGRLNYPGVYRHGLCVFCRNKPLQSVLDPVCVLPTDYAGIVCTDHSMDNTDYRTTDELGKAIIAMWYGMTHTTSFYRMDEEPRDGLLRSDPQLVRWVGIFQTMPSFCRGSDGPETTIPQRVFLTDKQILMELQDFTP